MDVGEEKGGFAAAHSHLERSGAKQLGFLDCGCAPACLVTWRRSLGLGSPPPEWGRRESEPRSEMKESEASAVKTH
jgi:hypothetical protein